MEAGRLPPARRSSRKERGDLETAELKLDAALDAVSRKRIPDDERARYADWIDALLQPVRSELLQGIGSASNPFCATASFPESVPTRSNAGRHHRSEVRRGNLDAGLHFGAASSAGNLQFRLCGARLSASRPPSADGSPGGAVGRDPVRRASRAEDDVRKLARYLVLRPDQLPPRPRHGCLRTFRCRGGFEPSVDAG